MWARSLKHLAWHREIPEIFIRYLRRWMGKRVFGFGKSSLRPSVSGEGSQLDRSTMPRLTDDDGWLSSLPPPAGENNYISRLPYHSLAETLVSQTDSSAVLTDRITHLHDLVTRNEDVGKNTLDKVMSSQSRAVKLLYTFLCTPKHISDVPGTSASFAAAEELITEALDGSREIRESQLGHLVECLISSQSSFLPSDVESWDDGWTQRNRRRFRPSSSSSSSSLSPSSLPTAGVARRRHSLHPQLGSLRPENLEIFEPRGLLALLESLHQRRPGDAPPFVPAAVTPRPPNENANAGPQLTPMDFWLGVWRRERIWLFQLSAVIISNFVNVALERNHDERQRELQDFLLERLGRHLRNPPSPGIVDALDRSAVTQSAQNGYEVLLEAMDQELIQGHAELLRLLSELFWDGRFSEPSGHPAAEEQAWRFAVYRYFQTVWIGSRGDLSRLHGEGLSDETAERICEIVDTPFELCLAQIRRAILSAEELKEEAQDDEKQESSDEEKEESSESEDHDGGTEEQKNTGQEDPDANEGSPAAPFALSPVNPFDLSESDASQGNDDEDRSGPSESESPGSGREGGKRSSQKRCRAETQAGRKCRNTCLQDSEVCWLHQPQQ